MKLRHLLLAFGLSLSAVLPAAAQDYPTRPIKVLIGFPPGGGGDIFGRVMSEKMSAQLEQPFVIENRPGANGNLAGALAARAPADGYTLLFVTSTHVVQPDLYNNLSYDPMKDLVPVGISVTLPLVMAANANFTASNIPDLISYAKRFPGKVTSATPGRGTPAHLTAEMLKGRAGVDIQIVHYNGSGPAANDILGGRVDMQVATLAGVMPQVRAGRLKILAQTGAKRSPLAPSIPTVAEGGVPGFQSDAWFAFLAPANVPRPILLRLNKAMNDVLATPEMRARLAELGADPVGGSLDSAAAFMREDQERWRKVIKDAGVKAE